MFEDKYMALEAIDNLLGIVEYLHKEFDISINDIYCNGLDAGWQITKELNIKKL